MAFSIYPDAATATALGKTSFTPIGLASGEAMAVFVSVAEHVGPDLLSGDQPTTFLCFSLSGPAIAQGAQPRFELIAHSPDAGPAASVDPNVATSAGAASNLTDGAGVLVASAWFVLPYTRNVYPMKVAIRRPGTRLSLRITNTTSMQRDIVWVAADNPAETQQPWLHVTKPSGVPIDFVFEAQAGSTQEGEAIRIMNFGTGATTVTGTVPTIAPPFSLAIPSTPIDPNQASPASARLSFQAPSTAGDFPPTTVRFATANKVDPGPFGKGHNVSFSFKARSVALPPPPPGPPVPRVIGKFNADAIAAIRQAGFVARILGRELVSGDGSCVEQRPEAGTFLARGERVRAYLGAPVAHNGQVLHDDILGSGGDPLPGD
jgi:hypothetical protein